MAYTGSKAKAGRGTIVSIGALRGSVTGTEAFTVIGELDDSSFSGGAWSVADTTNFESGADEEFIATTRNNGDLNIKGNLIDGEPGQVALAAAYNTGGIYDFTVQLPLGPGQTTKGTSYAFSALVMSYFEISVSTKGVVSFSGKLKISGGITATVGS